MEINAWVLTFVLLAPNPDGTLKQEVKVQEPFKTLEHCTEAMRVVASTYDDKQLWFATCRPEPKSI